MRENAAKEIRQLGEEEEPQGEEEDEDEDEEYGHVNKETGEVGSPMGPEPTHYGDWERNGRYFDF